jgi:hypothetical protein
MTNEFWLGATYTLACIFGGVLITLIFAAVLGDRNPDLFDEGGEWGPEPPIDPTPAELEAWLTENTTTEFFEANLRGDRR